MRTEGEFIYLTPGRRCGIPTNHSTIKSLTRSSPMPSRRSAFHHKMERTISLYDLFGTFACRPHSCGCPGLKGAGGRWQEVASFLVLSANDTRSRNCVLGLPKRSDTRTRTALRCTCGDQMRSVVSLFRLASLLFAETISRLTVPPETIHAIL